MTKFETGKTYTTRSVCDYDTVFRYTVTRRTAKTIFFADRNGNEKGRRVYLGSDGVERCNPEGTYSMCPVISADKVEMSDAELLDALDVEEDDAPAIHATKEERTVRYASLVADCEAQRRRMTFQVIQGGRA